MTKKQMSIVLNALASMTRENGMIIGNAFQSIYLK